MVDSLSNGLINSLATVLEIKSEIEIIAPLLALFRSESTKRNVLNGREASVANVEYMASLANLKSRDATINLVDTIFFRLYAGQQFEP